MAVESGLDALIRQEGDAAAERAEASWQANAAGRDLIGRTGADLTRSTPEFAAAVARAIRDWQGAVLDLVADEGMTRRSRARFFALGVNGIGVALMIVVFAHTGGLVGAEVGVAGGTAVLAQRVLEAVFGDQAVRRLAETAKIELDTRVEALLAGELLRYHALLDGLGVDPGQAGAIRQAVRAVEAARQHGLPQAPETLAPTGSRLALESPQARQVAAAGAQPAIEGDIVDAEIIETSSGPQDLS